MSATSCCVENKDGRIRILGSPCATCCCALSVFVYYSYEYSTFVWQPALDLLIQLLNLYHNQIETALGRSLNDDEVKVFVDEKQQEGEEDQEGEEEEEAKEDAEEDKPLTFDGWVAETCNGMKHLPESMDSARREEMLPVFHAEGRGGKAFAFHVEKPFPMHTYTSRP